MESEDEGEEEAGKDEVFIEKATVEQTTHNCTGFPTAQSLLGLNINYSDNTGKSVSPGR